MIVTENEWVGKFFSAHSNQTFPKLKAPFQREGEASKRLLAEGGGQILTPDKDDSDQRESFYYVCVWHFLWNESSVLTLER